MFDCRPSSQSLQQAIILTKIYKAESVEDMFIGYYIHFYKMRSYCLTHLVVSFDPDDVRALWEHPTTGLQVNSKPDMAKLHITI